MVGDQDQLPRKDDEWDAAVRAKLDGTLRRFIEMDDNEIREHLDQERRRLTERKEQISREIGALVEQATSAEERQAVRRVMRMRQRGLIPGRIAAAVPTGELAPARARAIVRFTGNRADLEALGLEVRSQAQDIFTIAGTRSQLFALAGQPACRRLRAPRLMFPMVEDACVQAEIDQVHEPRLFNPTGYRGEGVAIGVVDTPLDVTHHGFRDPDPSGAHGSRVLYYWAQKTHTVGPEGIVDQPHPPGLTPQEHDPTEFAGLNVGRLYTQEDIDAALVEATSTYGLGRNQICCKPTSTAEHGTHCAGIASGSGHELDWAAEPTHEGAAPRASMIHVGSRLPTDADIDYDVTSEVEILEGIDFCIRAAEFEGLPVVVSVSQGTSLGPHNGTSEYSQALDNWLNSHVLRSVVTGSGNDNDKNGYHRGSVPAGETAAFHFSATYVHVRRPGYPLWLDIWYNGPELACRVLASGGDSGTDWLEPGQGSLYDSVYEIGIDLERDFETAQGLHEIRIFIGEARYGREFTIELRNPNGSASVNYHAWVGMQARYGDVSEPTQNALTLSDPACGKSVLTVGAAQKVHPPNPASGEPVAEYSGAGPTLDGRVKPEIIAVGGTDEARDNLVWSTASDGISGYTRMMGTSMAAPLVAGSVALLFEEYSGLGYSLNQDTIKGLLTYHANRRSLIIDRDDPDFDEVQLNRYGFGRLRMIGPIDQVQPPVDVNLWIRTAEDDYGWVPFPGDCCCCAPDIRVYEAGTDTEITKLAWGTTYDVKVRVRNLGDSNANRAYLALKYARPRTAPEEWFDAADESGNKLNVSVDVPAMDSAEITFQWRPEQPEVGTTPETTHFCLLAEVDHEADPLVRPGGETSGRKAWSANIRGTNNVALRNVHIL